ncbi:hypothetical protein [Longimicrobium sp.]|jgi:hypothetical protein|uniref:hypothetical protein n=1 Tax=Longimicrobium sp. TaxID=2029185 RepID=UPI002ED9718D
MPEFVPPRDQDAWGTIRGFVYQAETTIKRWFGLRPGQVLELERGEDIDLVANSLRMAPDERDRVLEQIRHREANLSLRSPSVRASLAHFCQHQVANRELSLLLRFTTNTGIAREADTPVPGGVAGITAWQRLRAGAWADGEGALVEAIRALLKTDVRPDGVREDVWTPYQEWVRTCSTEELRAFVDAVEWATGAPDADSLGPEIRGLLIERGHADDDRTAEALYQRLFLYVFKLLSLPGVKRLTVEALAEQLRAPALAEHDRRLLAELVPLLSAVEARVAVLEDRVDRLDFMVAETRADVEELTRRRGITAAVEYRVSVPTLEPPPHVARLATRAETVAALQPDVERHAWVALHGTSGLGKSELVLLLAQAMGVETVWVRLRDLTTEQAAMLLDAAVEALDPRPVPGQLRGRYRALFERLGPDRWLVLDDVPRLADGDELASRLAHLVAAAAERGGRVVSTSAFPPPPGLLARMPPGAVHVQEAPAFTDTEAGEVFRAHGGALEPRAVEVLNTLAHGHPTLLQGVAVYLAEHGWVLSEEDLGRLLRTEYAVDVNDQTMERLIGTIEDADSREMLYRLNTLFGAFGLEEVLLLAEQEPAVARPRERLTRLQGLWVQRETHDRYAVSPLVRALGTADLRRDTARACHLALAWRLVGRPQIDSRQAVQALVHFISGDDHVSAALLLLRALAALNASNADLPDSGLLSVWIDVALPEQMPLALRLNVRASQIAVRHRRGRDIAYLEQDLQNLLAQAEPADALQVFGALVVAAAAFAKGDVRRSGRYMIEALGWFPRARESLPPGMEMPVPSDLGTLVWGAAEAIDSAEGMREWFAMLEALPPDLREEAVRTKVARQSLFFVANRFLMLEHRKTEDQRDWRAVAERTAEMAARARAVGCGLLWAGAVRSRMIVLAEELSDAPGATREGEAALAEAGEDAEIRFLLLDGLGISLRLAGRRAEAAARLEEARAAGTRVFPYESARATLRLAQLVGEDDPARAAALSREAAEEALGTGRVDPLATVRTLGELAIAEWLAGNRRASFYAWTEALERHLAAPEKGDEWRALTAVFGHHLYYCAIVASTEELPGQLRSGEPYAPPARGVFLNYGVAAAALYSETRVALTLANLAMLGEAVGEYRAAQEWARRGAVIARDAGAALALGECLACLFAGALLEDRFDDAVALAREAAPLWVARLEEQAGSAEERARAARLEAEAYLAGLVLIGAALRIGGVHLRDPEHAGALAEAAAAACEHIAENAEVPQLWRAAGELFLRAFRDGAAANAIAQAGESGIFPSPLMNNALRCVGYIGATVQAGVSPEMALAWHLRFARYLTQVFGEHRGVYDECAVPFFQAYWDAALARSRFRFRAPAHLERSLADVSGEPSRWRLQRLLTAVADGLGTPVEAGTREWLRGRQG